ncbi:MAG: hypothetical protein HC796_04990 [Synechococcaceae cyanobacterium RL_1_2]|nr:hypothetical protein [Synechococcaceae cyanobacterium RL_1_2]
MNPDQKLCGGLFISLATVIALSTGAIAQVSQLREASNTNDPWLTLEKIMNDNRVPLPPEDLDQLDPIDPDSLTRYEFAYYLHTLLANIERNSIEIKQQELVALRQLQRQLARELALFKADVDTFEAGLIDDNATTFSPNSSLRGYGWINVSQIETKLNLTAATRFELLSRFDGGDQLITQLNLGTGKTNALLYGGEGNEQLEIRELFYRSEIGDRVTMTIAPQIELSRLLQVNPYLNPQKNAFLNNTVSQNILASGAIAQWSAPIDLNFTLGLMAESQLSANPNLGFDQPKLIGQIAYQFDPDNTIQLIYNGLNDARWRASFAWGLNQNLGIFGSYDHDQWQAGFRVDNIGQQQATFTLAYNDAPEIDTLDSSLYWPINEKLALIPSFYVLSTKNETQNYGSNFKMQWEF